MFNKRGPRQWKLVKYQNPRPVRKKIVIGILTGTGIFLLCGIIFLLVLLLQSKEVSAAEREKREAAALLETVVVYDVEGMVAEVIEDMELPRIETVQGIRKTIYDQHPEWMEKFLTPNEYSRPGDELPEVLNIFVHYTANLGTTADQNRRYFERQKDEHLASVSAHFIIGIEGEIIQCIPLDEIAYAVQTRNFDSISIECCYKAKDGSFTQETYDSLISLLAWLLDAYHLEKDDILRHYDCGRKKCPLYYTEHPDAWELLKEDVEDARYN